ncbi:3-deoxy-manno-octulosonate cytidylyltransferase [Endozoicomonas sp. ALB115]|uniref:3-deoxy-manno-octulosonate cytidylyltransferase n=1 Tax=Endozoicomonas sp. ALB115 TaxID=3403074 RepID=UPI003BB61012
MAQGFLSVEGFPSTEGSHTAEGSDFTVVIPARFASSRLPGKPLADIAGKPMVQHVYERALASAARKVIIATDDERILKVADGFGAEVCMTLPGHPSGTDRLQEVARIYGLKDDEIIVNVQGDEPLIPPSVINQVARNLQLWSEAGAATLSSPLTRVEQIFDPGIVKVVADVRGYALYFSRAPIPWARDDFATEEKRVSADACFQRHIGIYAYRVGLLNHYVTWGVSPIESMESLEQLRLMWHGYRIHVAEAVATPPHGVDTEQDLQAVRALLEREQELDSSEPNETMVRA